MSLRPHQTGDVSFQFTSEPGARQTTVLIAVLLHVLQVPAGHHVHGLSALSETGEINETGQHLRPFIISLSRKRKVRKAGQTDVTPRKRNKRHTAPC